MVRNHYPTVNALSDEQAARLRALPEGPLHIEVHRQFSDDQAQCLDVEIAGVRVSLLWIGDEEAAAFYFHDESKRARDIVLDVIRRELKDRDEQQGE